MGTVEVVDRGGQEIVVFLSGDVDDVPAETFGEAVDEVATLERIGGLSVVVVNMQEVSNLGEPGLAFLRDLTEKGQNSGFAVAFAAMSGPAHRAVEAAGWEFVEHSPPPGS
ncbi:STAS domain-containing protein [Phytoactinopolyspora alkaliphila]|uniref:STAS domain-containing protein n=1 Tax=Phytoactinopolyspora alkaliphila TaxID=1783498 RepID=A0A6N9YIV5_9ACTN|nr:STAS domain-containing protein [Phytoactinopolyspora alkaliphila]NED94850.1 STAS domain-containing protein [Phytoactinopolyspora alkaliphila]